MKDELEIMNTMFLGTKEEDINKKKKENIIGSEITESKEETDITETDLKLKNPNFNKYSNNEWYYTQEKESEILKGKKNSNDIEIKNTITIKNDSSTSVMDGLLTLESSDITEERIDELEKKIGSFAKNIDMFMYNAVPYFAKNVASNAQSYTNGNIDPASMALGPGVETIQAAQMAKYFTPDELVKYFSTNFYSAMLFRGIGIKKGEEGFFSGFFKEWDGAIDLSEEQREGIQKYKNNTLGVGHLIVLPDMDDKGKFLGIPFEFNVKITESPVAAKYQAQEVLSRIGELQSYSGTSGMTITLETSYMATSLSPEVVYDVSSKDEFLKKYINKLPIPEDSIGVAVGGWLKEFSMPKIQEIERQYRSLVLPGFSEGTDEGSYRKPPLIRVRIGDLTNEKNEDNLYNGYLNYAPYEVKGKSGKHKTLRNFIATDVNIVKDTETIPYYLNEFGEILDVMGFTVTLNLTEVSTSYGESLPSFSDYWESSDFVEYDSGGRR
jgi:hypothetical protein